MTSHENQQWKEPIERFHDVTAAILVCQANPAGVGVFSYINTFLFQQIYTAVGHVSENALYCSWVTLFLRHILVSMI